jgi:dihydrofolate reductase
MRRIIVLSFISLDGVMQAPGGPEEDKSGGFKYGGWVAPFFYAADNMAGEFMEKQLKSADLLLGRKTFEIFAAYWPEHAEVWPGEDIKKLKDSEGSDIQVHGSGNLVQTLLRHDLVDELWLKTFPVTLGKGKRLFGEGAIPASFKLTDSVVTPNGVIFANYKRAGEIETGTVGE